MTESEWNEFCKKAKTEFKKVSQDISEDLDIAAKSAKETLKKADKLAGQAAITAEKIYKDLDLGKRSLGAGAGAKVGFFIGLRFPPAMKFCVAAGAAVGAVVGPDGVNKFKDWKNAHKNNNSDNTPTPKP